MRRRAAILLAAALAAGSLLATGGGARAVEPPVPFSAVAKSTWQTNGVAWKIVQSGGLVFAGGTFTSVRPPGAAAGTSEQARLGLVVLDAATGVPTQCKPSFTLSATPAQVQVRSLTVSPDGKTLYVGGRFSEVNGTARTNLAAIDIPSCSLVAAFAPAPNFIVHALHADAGTLYLGGEFSSVGGSTRAGAAAVTAVGAPGTPGALLPWAPAFDKPVLALARQPGGDQLAVGGRFDTVNGAASRAVAVLSAATGATVRAFPAGFVPANSVVKGLVADATGFYTANEGTGGGVFDGRIAVDWATGAERWRDACLGATQAVTLHEGELYSASHAHDCSRSGGFPDGSRHHLLAQSAATGALRNWFPNVNGGIGEALGPRDLVVATAGSVPYLWVAGEFTTVNGANQQGLTRFAQAPDAIPDPPALSVTSFRAGEAHVAWRAGSDNDNANLTYRVFRNGGATPVHTVSAASSFWQRKQLTFTDTGITPGSSPNYRVSVSDGLSTTSSPVRAAWVTGTSSRYANKVRGDGASFLWRYDAFADGYLPDSTANDVAGTVRASLTPVAGAITGEPSQAGTFGGTNGTIYSENRFPAPAAFTVETWFRTTTTEGGKLIGFGDKQTLPSSLAEKHVYMRDDGRLTFGVYANQVETITSPLAYNDGAWHLLAASQGPAGMTLYVDGSAVAANTVTTNQAYDGYWRAGGDNIAAAWPGKPTSDHWRGTLDETAVYPAALPATTVSQHWLLGTTGLLPAVVTPVDPTADTYANQGGPNTTFGSSPVLASRGVTIGSTSYLRFPLPAAPPAQTLTAASLRIRTTTDPASGSADPHVLRSAADTWAEETLTWNNAPAVSGPVYGTLPGGTVPDTWYTVVLDPLALAASLGASWTMTVSSAGSDNLGFWSRTFAGADRRPQLTLTFS